MVVQLKTQTVTVAEAINEAIRLEMRRNPRVILMGEDVAGGAAAGAALGRCSCHCRNFCSSFC